MIPASLKLQAALMTGHKVVTKAEVWTGSQIQPSWLKTLAITSGYITISSTNSIRRSCRVELTDPTGSLSPRTTADLLAPTTGNELWLYRGVDFQDATPPEFVPLGVFRIDQTQVEDSGQGLTITIMGYDRAKKVQRSGFVDVYSLAAGLDVYTAIQQIINSGTPGYTFRMGSSPGYALAGATYQTSDNPWDVSVKLGTDSAKQVYFDWQGQIVIDEIPNVDNAQPLWTFVEGPRNVILDLSTDWNEDKVYNYQLVTGESTGNSVPVRAVAQNIDPTDPASNNIAFGGSVAPAYKSPMITTADQALAVANSLLTLSKGQIVGFRFSSVVVPMLEAWDCIYVQRAKSGVNQKFVLDTVTMPLDDVAPMQCVARRIAA